METKYRERRRRDTERTPRYRKEMNEVHSNRHDVTTKFEDTLVSV